MEKRKIYIAPVTEVSEMSLMHMALENGERALQSYSIVKRQADGTFKHISLCEPIRPCPLNTPKRCPNGRIETQSQISMRNPQILMCGRINAGVVVLSHVYLRHDH